MKNFEESIIHLNRLVDFLARRDVQELTPACLKEQWGIDQVDVLILLGNSSLQSVELVKQAYNRGVARKLMIAGGMGHSTKYLVENVLKQGLLYETALKNKSEAEILQEILTQDKKIEKKDIILESESTNCGDNAVKSFLMLVKKQWLAQSYLLIQDPSMQLRTWASFRHTWERNQQDARFYNYACVKPYFAEQKGELVFSDASQVYCSVERYISLLLGEIPRLLDNETGYGPGGKNFIIHVDIPQEVLDSYEYLIRELGNSKYLVRL